MSVWSEVKLKTLCEKVTVGHVGSMAKEYVNEGIPFLRSLNIKPYYLDFNNLMFIDSRFHEKLKKSALKPGDVAIVRTGYPGTACVIPENLGDANCSDLVIVRPGRNLNPHFLAAIFNSSFGQSLVAGNTVGAAQQHFNITVAKELIFIFPVKDVQDKIAAILSAYDDLIENNKRRISLLEKMAEEIYREWFVRFRFPGYKNAEFEKGVPKGWEKVVFSNICKFEKGKNPDEVLDEMKDEAEIYINMQTITGKGLSYAVPQRNSVHCNVGDIIMLMDGSRSGLVFRSNKNGIVGSTMSVIRTDESLKNYVYEYLEAMNEAIIFNNTGSAIPHANKDYINRMLVYIPSNESLIVQFNQYYSSIYSMIENLRLQASQLEMTKTMLLPRLISGKLSVENLNIQFPPSMQHDDATTATI